jgi:hypothetical protein
MSNVNLTAIADNIKACGFLLEHEVTEKLRSNRWSVINNKYYVDDVQESAREIDLIAYKVNFVENISVYTTLIVSCKKSDSNLWALLFRDYEKDDPNINWFPIKVWSNDKVLKYMTSNQGWQSSFIGVAKDHGLYEELFEPTGHLFAFQEMDKVRHTVQNDKNIFNAVSSLMKAESYEMNRLEGRKKNVALYNFNLLSIVDSELVKIHFKGKEITPSIIKEAKSIFNYIVSRQETASRVHFCTFDSLDKYLTYYNQLHNLNCSFFDRLLKSYYEDVFTDEKHSQLLRNDFEKRVLPFINAICREKPGIEKTFLSINFRKLTGTGPLEIELLGDVNKIEYVNNHSYARDIIKNGLKNIYRYSGEFVLVEDDVEIPF